MKLTRAVLFDIDGTLLRSSGAGVGSLSQALCEALGADVEKVEEAIARIDFRGATDRAILAQLEAHLGGTLAPPSPFFDAYLQAMELRFRPGQIAALPGVLALIAHLEALPHVHVGLLTGNVREAARRKLRPLGLEHLADRAGGFGEDGYYRSELAHCALARLSAMGWSPGRVIVVGDTEHDVACARAIGAVAVAVETGWTSRQVLLDAEPDALLPSLKDGVADLQRWLA